MTDVAGVAGSESCYERPSGLVVWIVAAWILAFAILVVLL